MSHPKTFADRLRHSSIVIAMDRYGHTYDEHEDEIAADLDGMYKAAVPEGRMASVSPIG